MKWIKFMTILFFMTFIVFSIANSSMVERYIMTQKSELAISNMDTVIGKYAKENNSYPIEPRVDKVWKLIPGYNGLIVDEEATKRLITENKITSAEEINYIWKEVSPQKKLKDLGAYPIYRGNPNKQSVTLMINVAWGTEYLDSMLKTMKSENINAIFFLDGSWLKKNREMAVRIVEEGHEIGNHAYSHPMMSKLSDERIKQEIYRTEELIQDLTNENSLYLAPPAGDYNDRVVKIAHEAGLQTVLWTLDTVDWKKPSPETIIYRIIPEISNGNLVLMHPTESTAKALPELIRKIKEKGLYISTLSETLSSKRINHVEPLDKF